MSNYIIQSSKLLGLILLILLLQSCGTSPSSSEQSRQNQKNLSFLLKQVQSAPASKKDPLLVQAAGLLVIEKRFEKSQELLIRVNKKKLTPSQKDDFRLFYGETLLALDAKELSLVQIRSVATPSRKPIHWQIRYAKSLSDSYLANNNYFESAKSRIELTDLINTPESLTENNEKIWFALDKIETNFLQKLNTSFNSKRLNGWLRLVYLNKRWGYHPKRFLKELSLWKKRYPTHPLQIYQPKILQQTAKIKPLNPKHIAVLLPLSGKNAKVAALIHDGILAAHYQASTTKPVPKISFYDTAHSLSSITPYQKSIKQGADFIIGPLTKKSIESILKQEQLNIPILALNRLDKQNTSYDKLYQFGLPIEDEAIQSAARAFEKGYRKAIAILPSNSQGRRAEKSFREHFQKLGGKLIDIEKYKNTKALKQKIQRLLGINNSIRRNWSLQQLLGRNLEFEMRRRQDADFIFILARPEIGRIIKPFINYYYANNLPIISTSSIFSGKNDPKKDIDLNGIEFPDIPLLLSQLPEYKQARQMIKSVAPEVLNSNARYFSLGYDSYNLISELPILQAFPQYHLNGLAGELNVDEDGIIHRKLTWAQFNRGIPNTTKEQQLKKVNPTTSYTGR